MTAKPGAAHLEVIFGPLELRVLEALWARGAPAWSAFNPRSTRLTLNRLLANNPAGTSSAIDIAICTVASVVRKRRAAFAPPGCPAWFFSVAARSGRVLCRAGNTPNASPVRIAAALANTSIDGLSVNANMPLAS